MHRIVLTRIRCSAHNLDIEDERFRSIDRENRKCVFCTSDAIDSEYHLVIFVQFIKNCDTNFRLDFIVHGLQLQVTDE